MAINAPSRVETPKVGKGPLNGANTATLIGPASAAGAAGAAAGWQEANKTAASKNTDTKIRFDIF